MIYVTYLPPFVLLHCLPPLVFRLLKSWLRLLLANKHETVLSDCLSVFILLNEVVNYLKRLGIFGRRMDYISF